VVIVTWNAGPDLLRCLQSLQAGATATGWEAIVVDNGSTDGSIARVRAEFPAVRVIANARNRGLAAGNNQGIAASAAPFVLISNPDVLFARGAIDALLSLMSRRPSAAFAIAKLRDPDGEIQTSAGDLPSATEALLGRRLSWQRERGGERAGVWWHRWAHDEELPVGHGAEACYLVRRSAVAEIGLQDERFVLDWEGLEWSRRARRAGWEIWFCPSAEVTHLGGTSVRQVPVRWVLSTHYGMYRYFRGQSVTALRPLLALVVAVRAAIKVAVVTLDAGAYRSAHRARRR
jgi:N-acetylglucosaminyl-diphospho-decaprenol L-rhamnosyltransferase